MKKTILLSLMAVIGIAINANEPSAKTENSKTKTTTSAITGTIVDKLTGEPLSGVEVILMDTELKAYTDLDGNFKLQNVFPGAHAIKIDYISYQGAVENIKVEAGNTEKIEVKLKNVEK